MQGGKDVFIFRVTHDLLNFDVYHNIIFHITQENLQIFFNKILQIRIIYYAKCYLRITVNKMSYDKILY